MSTVDEIVTFIKARLETISDSDLMDLVDKRLGTVKLDFCTCAQIDNKLYGKGATTYRGYFRSPYNYPVNGTTVNVPMGDGITEQRTAVDCAFFTFGTAL